MKRLILAFFICTVFTQAAIANETKAQAAGEGKDFHKFDFKESKQVEPDKANLEKHKDIVNVYKEYWKAVTDKDYKKAYSMEAASYQKKVSYDLYAERFKKGAKIIAVEPIEVKQKNEKEVSVRGFLRFKTEVMNSIKTFDDIWIKEGDVLKHLKENDKGGGEVKQKSIDIKKLDK